jgi:hypothetical protein
VARIRTVKPEFFQHEELGAQAFAARLLAIGLMQLADGHGRLRWVPKQIEAHVFPWDEVDLEALATGLESAGILLRYQVGSRRFACFPNFRKHQRITGKEAALESKYPHPDEATTNGVNAQGISGEASGCFPEKHLGAQEQGTGNREQGTDIVAPSGATLSLLPVAPERSPVDEVWDHYCERRNNRTKISASARDKIAARIKSTSVEACKLVIDWTHDAPGASHLRADGNDRGKDYTRWGTIFVRGNFDKYKDEADDWKALGCETEHRQSYSEHEWFESEMSRAARQLDLSPEAVTIEWAGRHPLANTVPAWAIERAVRKVREERA